MSSNLPISNIKDHRAETLADEITELYGYITAATYELLLKIREFDTQELWAGPGMVSCAHWLNWKCGIGMNAAREKVRVARALGDLPKISEAFRSGQVSFSKVRAMTRVANADNEDYLLMIAMNGTAHHVESLVRGYRRAERLSKPDAADQQHASRSFNHYWDDDGSLVINGRLPAEVGAMLIKALQASIDQQDKEVTAVTREPVSARRADAIAEMAESYLATGPAQSSSADRYQVMLHVAAETSESPAHIENGPHVTAVTSRRICCDASTSKIVEDETGEPLSIGRKSRVIPPAMRRALKARDRQCRFPGCTHQHFIDGHHIKHWADGGETSLVNLVQLCRHHHRLVHEGGFVCETDAAGNVVFRDQEGVQVDASGQFSRHPVNVVAHLRDRLEDRYINAQTVIPDWHGEDMDRDLAVGLLWDLKQRETLPQS